MFFTTSVTINLTLVVDSVGFSKISLNCALNTVLFSKMYLGRTQLQVTV